MEAQIEIPNDTIIKLMHYFLTIKKYNPIILQGLKDELWLENMDEDYKIIRIVSKHIHNKEQYEYDKNRLHFILKQIKRKTFSFKLKTLTIYTDINDNVDLYSDKDLDFIKFDYNDNIKNNPIINKYFVDIDKSLNKKEEGIELLKIIGDDITKSNIKKNEEVKSIFRNIKPRMTDALIIINILIFIIQLILGNDFIITHLGLHPFYVLEHHQFYRLITSMFLHANIIHILFNMYALYIIGPQIENFYGRVKFGIIYLVSGIFGSLFSILFTQSWSVGASGAIFGLLGAILYFGYHYRIYLGDVIKSQIIPVIIINLLIGFMSTGIDNAAHIGGLLGGICASMIVGINKNNDKTSRINEIIISLIFIAFILYMVFFR